MKTIFHKILATTALCLAAMGLSFGCDTISADSGISALLKQKEEILTPVKDYASARKAAELLNALKKSTSDYFLPACDPRMAKLNELSRQLEEAYYYGCPALARAMGADWQDAISPTAVSSQNLSRMKKKARNNISRYLTPEQLADVSGGPGFSVEEAWILRTTEPFAAGELGSRIALYAVDDSRSCICREVIIAERRYNVYTVEQISKDTKHLVEQWVDCTASRKVYPETERKAAMQELLNRYRTIHQLLMSIDDEDSALDAMEQIAPLVEMEEHEKLRRIAETSYSMWGFFSLILTEEEMKAYHLQQRHLEESDYYGVKELQEFLYVPPCH